MRMATSATPEIKPYRKILCQFRAMKQFDSFGVGKPYFVWNFVCLFFFKKSTQVFLLDLTTKWQSVFKILFSLVFCFNLYCIVLYGSDKAQSAHRNSSAEITGLSAKLGTSDKLKIADLEKG